MEGLEPIARLAAHQPGDQFRTFTDSEDVILAYLRHFYKKSRTKRLFSCLVMLSLASIATDSG